MLDLALPDDWLADTADVGIARHRRNIQADLHAYFASRVHSRRNVDVHAHIEILKLRVDQRVDAYSTDARLKRTRRHRHAVTDLQRGLLSIECSNLRILDDLGAAVPHDGCGCGARNRDGEIGRVQIADAVEVNATARRVSAARLRNRAGPTGRSG